MRFASLLVAIGLLGGCGGPASQRSQEASASANGGGTAVEGGAGAGGAVAADASPLAAGLYEVSIVETIAGVGSSPEQRSQECVSPEMAAHPESFIAPPSLPRCTGAAPVRDGSEIQGEMQCEGNRVLSIQTNLSRDGWEQSVSGEGPNGTYQSQETAHRIGDC